LPETIPETFNDTLNKYAIKGFRVLAMAFKTIKMSYIQSQQITRDKAENKMIFLGLLIVQNKLKPETRPTLNILESAGLKMVMATGDNILTAISVSKECELIKKNSLVYSCEIEGNQLVWNAVENFDEENDPGEFIIETRKEGDPNNLIITDSTGKSTNLFEKGNEINTNSNNIINDFDYNKKGDGNKGSGSMNIFKSQDNNNESKGAFGDIINTNVENRPSLNQKRISIASGLDYDGSSFIDNFPPDRYSILYSKRPSVMVNVPILPGEKEINPNIPQDDSNLMGLEIKEYPFQNVQEDYVIAMTGKTFETLCAFRERFLTTNNENYRIYNDVFKLILLHGRVFARMAPEHKALLVEGFKKEQLAVLMCGDGANDCMALRTANIGVSLSEEEASIAAPFTSKNQNISCLVPLLKEGKSSLVTSIQTFKYMMMYSLVQFLCVTMLMVLNSYLSENQFLSVDIFIIIPLAFFIPATGPYKLLTKHHPTDSLISYPVIASILSQTIIAFVFQLAAHYILVYMLEDYENICQPDDDDTDILACPDNTSVFLISNMQYLITAFAFSISKPFKSPIYTNYYLTFFMIFAFVYSCFIIVFPNKLSVDLLQLYNFDDPENSYKDDRRDDIDDEDLYIYKDTQIKYYIQGLALLNFIISYIFEKVIIPATTAIWNARKIRQLRDIKRIQSEQALTMQQLFQISE
jgi:cation-transporting ATPase 13A3/4/5